MALPWLFWGFLNQVLKTTTTTASSTDACCEFRLASVEACRVRRNKALAIFEIPEMAQRTSGGIRMSQKTFNMCCICLSPLCPTGDFGLRTLVFMFRRRTKRGVRADSSMIITCDLLGYAPTIAALARIGRILVSNRQSRGRRLAA